MACSSHDTDHLATFFFPFPLLLLIPIVKQEEKRLTKESTDQDTGKDERTLQGECVWQGDVFLLAFVMARL